MPAYTGFLHTSHYQGRFQDVGLGWTYALQNKWKVVIFASFDRSYGRYGDHSIKDFDNIVETEFNTRDCEVFWPYIDEGRNWGEAGIFLRNYGFQRDHVYILDPNNTCVWLERHAMFPDDMNMILDALKQAQQEAPN